VAEDPEEAALVVEAVVLEGRAGHLSGMVAPAAALPAAPARR
jgi:hypothetical protein